MHSNSYGSVNKFRLMNMAYKCHIAKMLIRFRKCIILDVYTKKLHGLLTGYLYSIQL